MAESGTNGFGSVLRTAARAPRRHFGEPAWRHRANDRLERSTRVGYLSITHISSAQFEAELDVHETDQPPPDHHVPRRRVLRPRQGATQLGDRLQGMGYRAIRGRTRGPAK